MPTNSCCYIIINDLVLMGHMSVERAFKTELRGAYNRDKIIKVELYHVDHFPSISLIMTINLTTKIKLVVI